MRTIKVLYRRFWYYITMSFTLWLLVLVAMMDISTAQVMPQNDPNYSDCNDIIDLTGDVAQGPNTVRLCEKDNSGRGIYAVLFDWNLRIPHITQTHLNGAQIKAKNPGRYRGTFVTSELIDVQYQANTDDYDSLNERTPKYETSINTLQLDTDWSNNSGAKTPVHRGHMVADQYVKESQRKFTTYRFTNVVPQFGRPNCGPWCQLEKALMTKWSQTYCTQTKAAGNKWDMYIATGAVPSAGTSQRWFGRFGFGSQKDQACSIKYNGKRINPPSTTWPYRLNVPTSMWTAACCLERDHQDNIVTYRNTAFSVGNVPDSKGTIIKAVAPTLPGNPQPFTAIVECTQQQYYTIVKEDAVTTYNSGPIMYPDFWIMGYLVILMCTVLLQV